MDWPKELPDKIEGIYASLSGNMFAGLNRDTAGKRADAELPVFDAKVPMLLSLATPNGQKAGIMFEELVDAVPNFQYVAHRINIMAGEQFNSGFVKVNPNSRIPCMVIDGHTVFESGAMLIYLAEKYKMFLPKDEPKRSHVISWVMWQMSGQGPMFGQFGHFYRYAPRDQLEVLKYGVSRYGMEVRRLLSVMDNHLQGKTWFVGEEYTIADMACFPWVENIARGYKADKFLGYSRERYPHVFAWTDRMKSRNAVLRGMCVCGGATDSKNLVKLSQHQNKLWVPKL